jgi:hypothetical protein
MRIAAWSVTGAPVTAASFSSATTPASTAPVTATTHSEPNTPVRAATGSEAALRTGSAPLANFITAAMTSSRVVAWSTAATVVSTEKGNAGNTFLVGGAGTATTGSSGATHVALNGEDASMG